MITAPCGKLFFLKVRMEGLEPPHLAASDPKSDVSTNFTTSGKRAANVGFLRGTNLFRNTCFDFFCLFKKISTKFNNNTKSCRFGYSHQKTADSH